MTSNAVESFNAWIIEKREMHIIQMIDSIKIGISDWFVERRNEAKGWTGALVSTKEDMWNFLSGTSRTWFVSECPGGVYEVLSTSSVTVNL